ncbi:alanyl-tRNA synthetase [Fusarium pseudoanthophilum]|uniref:Alanyl-tRNA synthetase n=1 Tax=Fusarium pseudoanthophilum TaxID=48495 RepID=A0A8H5PM49_9HYPO|nr:alanyl-tRNA synthetase [Fusarium pseudoanthophilum]
MASAARTVLTFQRNAKLHSLQTLIAAIRPFGSLETENRELFKQGTDEDYAVVTEETIFHPQGGGQPSDVGKITDEAGAAFTVASARMDAVRDGQVLHFGRFESDKKFTEGHKVTQEIDVEKRLLYSRYHTAGHVLGSAVNHLLKDTVEGFEELKASHFPDSASCEFQGLIDGKYKEPIQKKVDEFLAAKMPVEIDWWDAEEFRKNGLEHLTPDASLLGPGETKFRVVRIVGAEVYPCGGTHVDTTDLCGETTVKKIARSKGKSKVSYLVK